MSAVRRLSALTAVAVLSFATIASAQNNRIWTGAATPDNNWTTIGNWNLGVPASGDTAFFNSIGSSNNAISLGGAAQPIKTIEFDNGITPAYTLGVLGSGDKFNVDTGGSILVTETVATLQTINADLQLSNASISNSGDLGLVLNGNIVAGGTLSVINPTPSTTTAFNGNITEVSGTPASLTLSAIGVANTGNSFVFNGTNTYTGGTTITVNTGTGGSIQVGSNSPFGTGLVSVNAATVAPQFSSVGGDHTIPNAFNLSAGITPTGSNSLSFLGSITVTNPTAGGVRTFTNQIITAGKSVTFGATPNSSTLTLGGGDGIGKGLVFAPIAGSTTVVNDVIQDPAAGGGAASGTVQIAGGVGAVTKLGGLNTYTGGTMLNGSSTVQIASDSNAGGTAGPFGLGTLTFNNAINNILQPVGGNRSVANPISMLFGITAANAPSDTSGLTLSGPITQGGTGRSITNNLAGMLTLGLAATPSTFTLPTSGSQSVALVGTGPTVINDVIQDAAGPPSPAATISYSGTGSTTLNAQNTYAGDTIFNGSSTVKFSKDSNAGGTAGPFGQGTLKLNSSTNNILEPIGGNRVVANPVSMLFGLTVANAASDNSGLTLSGPITLAASGRNIVNNFVGGTLTFGAAASPSTWTLPTTGGQTMTISGGGATVINDVIQNGPSAPSPATVMAFSGTGLVTLNGHNTYSGDTLLNGSSVIQFSTDYTAGGTSGPLGLGNINFNSSTNSTLEPIGGDRVLANPVLMTFGMKFGSAASDSSNLTMTAPITMAASGRTLTNNMTGTLTFGSAASPSTWTLPTTGGQTLSIIGTGATVINDVIQNAAGAPTPATAMSLGSAGSVALNALNTYTGDTTVSGLAETIRFGASSNALPGASFTAGPVGTGNLILNNTSTAPILQPVGADRTVSNAVTLTSGFTASNVSGTPFSLTLAGPITLGATSRIISNNIPNTASLVLGAAGAPSTFTIGSTITIQSQVAGAGSTIINDAVTGAGGMTVQGGAVVQLNNATNDFAGTTLVTAAGSKLLVNGGKTSAGAITINTSGTLGGTGIVAGAIANSGTIAPGITSSAPGTLTTTGNVTMAANSHLAIDLVGGSADKLAVGGNLDLSNVDFLDISGPHSGLSYVIASYTGTLTGTFNNVTAGYTLNYGTGTNSQITLNIPLSNVKGDFNNNGKVDAADYVLWRNNLGTNNALLNDNGLGTPISQSQYNLWRANFNSPGSGSGSLASGEVPEPASVVLLLVGCGAHLAGSRRRRRS